jgi:UDP-N-acetylglucosamine diphosphorylase/glucosamine-1-phosphate N-acetyltransferase
MNLCLYEDPEVARLGPLTLLRPVFALRCGIFTLAEKLVRAFPQAPLHLVVRPALEEWTRLLFPTAHVGAPPDEETLFVNGRLCLTDDEVLHFLAAMESEASYMHGGALFAAKVKGPRVAHAARWLAEGNPERAFEDLRYPAEVTAFLVRAPADLIRFGPRQIVQDVKAAIEGGVVRGTVDEGARLLAPESIHIARGARVMAGAVLNAEGGPIWVGEGATIEPLAYVEGPASVGERSLVKALARIRSGTSIGPVCKVGGEVEASIFQGYSNKQHDGFLGHSFIGEWVNLGANTNTSDLKNTYSNVRTYGSAHAYRERRGEDSGQMLLGLTVGDLTKSGISTSFTTGSTIGLGCNLYGTEIMPAYVPSFVWGSPGAFTEHRIEAVIETAARVMQRRKTDLATPLDSLIRTVHEATREDRNLFLGAPGPRPAGARA